MDEFLQGATPLLNRILFDYSLPVGVVLTFGRLLALSWRSNYRYTEWLDFTGQLVPLMGVKKTQLREHLRWLQVARLVSWTIDAQHRYRIFILPAGNPAFGMAEYVGGGVDSQFTVSMPENHHHQLTQSANPAGMANEPPGTEAGAYPVGALLANSDRYARLNPGDDPAEFPTGLSTGSPVAEGEQRLPDPIDAQAILPPGTGAEPGFSGQLSPSGEGKTRTDLPGGASASRAGEARPVGIPGASGAGLSPLLAELWALQSDPAFVETMGWLSRVGVWTDHAVQIARQIAANENQASEYLPTRADVLGWMAYCFAYRKQNEIEKPLQALAANLRANRRCPSELRPPRVCRVCGFTEGWCQCSREPDYVYPPDFIEQALKMDGALYRQSWWGTCPECHNLNCQCGQDDDEWDEAEDDWLDDEDQGSK